MSMNISGALRFISTWRYYRGSKKMRSNHTVGGGRVISVFLLSFFFFVILCGFEPSDIVYDKCKKQEGYRADCSLFAAEGAGKASAPGCQPVVVVIQQQRSATVNSYRLENPVTVGETAVRQGQLPGRLAIDPACTCRCRVIHHRAAPQSTLPASADTRQSKRRNTRVPLVPPKPNELESAQSILRCCAVWGT